MDCKRIIENGYGRLVEKLPEFEKGILNGFKLAMEALDCFKENLDDFIDNDVKIIFDIEKQVADLTIENAIEWIDETHDEYLISFVDSNHYSIDEQGNIVDDGEEDNYEI